MSEWFKEPVLKTGDSSRAVGSNPTLSATSKQAPYPSLPPYGESSLIALLLLSKSQPLTLGCDLVAALRAACLKLHTYVLLAAMQKYPSGYKGLPC